MSKFLTVSQVSEMVGLSVASIYRYTSQRMIPHIKLSRRVVFDENVILDWLKNQSIEAGSLK